MDNVMRDALQKGGFDISNNESAVKEITAFSQIRYPFGDLYDRTDGISETITSKGCFNNINNCLKRLEQITAEEFSKQCKVALVNSLHYYLLSNIDRVRVGRLDENSYVQQHYIVAYFVYTKRTGELRLIVHLDNINKHYNEKDYIMMKTLLGDTVRSQAELLLYMYDFLSKFEFIPLFIDDNIEVKISHKEYRRLGRTYREVTCPVLGRHILKEEWLMEGLKDYLSKGHVILKNDQYLVHENWKDAPGTLYLYKYKTNQRLEDEDYLVMMAIETKRSAYSLLSKLANCIPDKKMKDDSMFFAGYHFLTKAMAESIYESGEYKKYIME